jgi:hypothetical protein
LLFTIQENNQGQFPKRIVHWIGPEPPHFTPEYNIVHIDQLSRHHEQLVKDGILGKSHTAGEEITQLTLELTQIEPADRFGYLCQKFGFAKDSFFKVSDIDEWSTTDEFDASQCDLRDYMSDEDSVIAMEEDEDESSVVDDDSAYESD